jgi:hypothetical protein
MLLKSRMEMATRSLARRYLRRTPLPDLPYDPYNKAQLKDRARQFSQSWRNEPQSDPLAACRRLISLIETSYPIDELVEDYFQNLDLLLRDESPLESPGRVVIGLGPGRCGSTSLSGMLGTIPKSCCTHETPSLISWIPESEQIEFHIRRFRVLTRYFSVVSDVAHWWLNVVGKVFDEFPEARAIGLLRDPAECAVSFMRIQGFGKGTFNPWAVPGNRLWLAGPWDATYPSYPVPTYAGKNPDRAKHALVTRYVTEYNSQMKMLAADAPTRFLLVRTERLSRVHIQNEIFRFAGARGRNADWRLNIKKVDDGKKNQINF